MNINAAKGLHDVMKSNLGPKGTIKMLVSGAGGESSLARMHTVSNLCPRCKAVKAGINLFVGRYKVDEGRQRFVAGDANPKPDGCHDCTHCSGSG